MISGCGWRPPAPTSFTFLSSLRAAGRTISRKPRLACLACPRYNGFSRNIPAGWSARPERRHKVSNQPRDARCLRRLSAGARYDPRFRHQKTRFLDWGPALLAVFLLVWADLILTAQLLSLFS